MFRFTVPDAHPDADFYSSNIAHGLRGAAVRVLVSQDSSNRRGRQIEGVLRGVDRGRPDWLGLRLRDPESGRAMGNTFYVKPEAIHLMYRPID